MLGIIPICTPNIQRCDNLNLCWIWLLFLIIISKIASSEIEQYKEEGK